MLFLGDYAMVIPPFADDTARTRYSELLMLRTSMLSPSAAAPVTNVNVDPVAGSTLVTSLMMVPTKVAPPPATVMVGEKAADHILGRAPLARSNREPWINPRWRTADR